MIGEGVRPTGRWKCLSSAVQHVASRACPRAHSSAAVRRQQTMSRTAHQLSASWTLRRQRRLMRRQVDPEYRRWWIAVCIDGRGGHLPPRHTAPSSQSRQSRPACLVHARPVPLAGSWLMGCANLHTSMGCPWKSTHADISSCQVEVDVRERRKLRSTRSALSVGA